MQESDGTREVFVFIGKSSVEYHTLLQQVHIYLTPMLLCTGGAWEWGYVDTCN